MRALLNSGATFVARSHATQVNHMIEMMLRAAYLLKRLRDHGVTFVGRGYYGDYAAVRRQEIAAALNRLRGLKIHRQC